MGISQQEWLLKNSLKKHKHELKRKKKRKHLRLNDTDNSFHKKNNKINNKAQHNKWKKVKAPSNFSLIRNTEAVLIFFNKLKGYIKHSEPVIFDMEDVEYLSIDTILYFLSIMRRFKSDGVLYKLKGNTPKNFKANQLLRASGFLSYVNSDKLNYCPDENIVAIKAGSIADPKITREICDFVIMKLKLENKIITHQLYDLIFEMILNTVQHAYDEIKSTSDKWFIFCRFIEETKSIKFIFLDTGAGIPNTIKKTKMEKLQLWLNKKGIVSVSETSMLQSALEGAYRTRTEKDNRGKGLPRIYSLYESNYIQKLVILTNYAYYNSRVQRDHDYALNGTLFSWEIDKECLEHDYYNS